MALAVSAATKPFGLRADRLVADTADDFAHTPLLPDNVDSGQHPGLADGGREAGLSELHIPPVDRQ